MALCLGCVISHRHLGGLRHRNVSPWWGARQSKGVPAPRQAAREKAPSCPPGTPRGPPTRSRLQTSTPSKRATLGPGTSRPKPRHLCTPVHTHLCTHTRTHTGTPPPQAWGPRGVCKAVRSGQGCEEFWGTSQCYLKGGPRPVGAVPEEASGEREGRSPRLSGTTSRWPNSRGAPSAWRPESEPASAGGDARGSSLLPPAPGSSRQLPPAPVAGSLPALSPSPRGRPLWVCLGVLFSQGSQPLDGAHPDPV